MGLAVDALWLPKAEDNVAARVTWKSFLYSLFFSLL